MSGVPEKPSLENVEPKWIEAWNQNGTYAFDRSATRDNVFSIDTPPPTVSGSLHMGHVFSYTHTDTVVVVGIGGIGINAVQGARMAGAKRIIAIDPVEFKREKAMEFGATHTYASMAEAIPHLMELSWGEMADRVIMTPGVLHGDMMGEAMTMVGKGGTCVVTAISPMDETSADINLFQLAMWNKEVKGTIFGSLNPRADIPKLLDMYRVGDLKLDELITKRYTLDEINEGYRAMREGENIRGVIVNG